ncbi:PE-PGRS family protein [Thecamonas trahens ATCC 50062]|uniref:PE-PGRS family protein n=1 Tax=Thecamonas trahens ATCC 50062 TaxID=461836 RepID=A0A0L0DN56_THETB|nr:PE-PGRS family protein [Thecamonas trahens ATCC 50062]KNC53742.1 PE-PGRS family protein [Thecamonas trahens ATCC 50062]|eukprot:XP_013754305.1 PE-PGRS family protein [Thecamonas trahens ATCC 50062]
MLLDRARQVVIMGMRIQQTSVGRAQGAAAAAAATEVSEWLALVAEVAKEASALSGANREAGAEAEADASAGLADAIATAEDAQIDEMYHLALDEAACPGGGGGGAYVAIAPGAGGADAGEWAQMLGAMYLRWHGRHARGRDASQAACNAAGAHGVDLVLPGVRAEGWLAHETGVHKLVRRSPFASGRRHTSFASVRVLPLPGEAARGPDGDSLLASPDVRVETFRASGPGGQSVNTTDSAVRLTHLPTGISAVAADRSQGGNKRTAARTLAAKLAAAAADAAAADSAAAYAALDRNAFGSGGVVRSYVLDPYTMHQDATGPRCA